VYAGPRNFELLQIDTERKVHKNSVEGKVQQTLRAGTVGARCRSGYGTALQNGRSRVRFPMVSLEFFTMVLGSTQHLTEMSSRCISWG
jgi:hypothetical protein